MIAPQARNSVVVAAICILAPGAEGTATHECERLPSGPLSTNAQDAPTPPIAARGGPTRMDN